MQVTEESKYIHFQPFEVGLDKDSKETLKKAAERKYGEFWSLRLGDVFKHFDGDFSRIGVDVENLEEVTVYQKYWMEGFKEWAEQFLKVIEKLRIKPTGDAAKANQGCLDMTFAESAMIFCREYFGLSNFSSSEDITVGEFILAKKDSYNRALFEHNMSNIQMQKMKIKK